MLKQQQLSSTKPSLPTAKTIIFSSEPETYAPQEPVSILQAEVDHLLSKGYPGPFKVLIAQKGERTGEEFVISTIGSKFICNRNEIYRLEQRAELTELEEDAIVNRLHYPKPFEISITQKGQNQGRRFISKEDHFVGFVDEIEKWISYYEWKKQLLTHDQEQKLKNQGVPGPFTVYTVNKEGPNKGKRFVVTKDKGYVAKGKSWVGYYNDIF